MRGLIALMLTLPTLCAAQDYGGVTFPEGAVSFADVVVGYAPGSNASTPYTDARQSLGAPDYVAGGAPEYVSLGNNGELVVQFTNNALTTSGDSAKDLWIFEIGAEIEPTQVYISRDGIDWVDVGSTAGGTGGIDIDAYVGAGVLAGEHYHFVRLVDLLPAQSGSPWAGADIDAVGAISSTVGPCGSQSQLQPALYQASSGVLTIPAVLVDGQCYQLILETAPNSDLEFNTSFWQVELIPN